MMDGKTANLLSRKSGFPLRRMKLLMISTFGIACFNDTNNKNIEEKKKKDKAKNNIKIKKKKHKT